MIIVGMDIERQRESALDWEVTRQICYLVYVVRRTLLLLPLLLLLLASGSI